MQMCKNVNNVELTIFLNNDLTFAVLKKRLLFYMITRRNIRINVFQTIYELAQQQSEFSKAEAQKYFLQKLDSTEALLAAATQLVYSVSNYVLIYANQRASRRLANTDDKNVITKLTQNQILLGLKRNEKFTDVLKKHKLSNIFDDSFIKKLFLLVFDNPIYRAYIHQPELSLAHDRKVMNMIAEVCIFNNDDTTNVLTEHFMNLYNDDELIKIGIERVFTNPATYNFSKLISQDKLQYGEDLINCYFDKKDILFQLIEPKLINWDAERVAIIDTILLHLAISEMLYFPSIPLKVTINEYIDIAKEYSTPQSGQFVNGLLDNVRKDLEKENKIFKQEFKK
jgi:N utilization substance protein B